MTTPPLVIACRDCRWWKQSEMQKQLQAQASQERGWCKGIPGTWATNGDDYCSLWTAKEKRP